MSRPYSFAYKIRYAPSSNSYAKLNDGKPVSGSYHVLLPDGRTEAVNYRTDKYPGYVADVKYSQAVKVYVPSKTTTRIATTTSVDTVPTSIAPAVPASAAAPAVPHYPTFAVPASIAPAIPTSIAPEVPASAASEVPTSTAPALPASAAPAVSHKPSYTKKNGNEAKAKDGHKSYFFAYDPYFVRKKYRRF